MQTLRLKKNQEKRLNAGHIWIYSNEINVEHTPLSAFQSGEIVQIETHNGAPLGQAYINPHTLLCARLLTQSPAQTFNREVIEQRLQQALHLRNAYLKQPYYRLVYGESDGLPGLVVDRYGDYLSVQITTAGMDQLQDSIIAALQNVLQPKGILWRNDSSARTAENLPLTVEMAAGTVPAQVEISENGAQFGVSLWQGQKTGWFYDHRDNRALVQKFAPGKRILDLFSYTGSFAIQAAVAGAHEVHAIDSSAQAIEWLRENAKRNNVNKKVHTQVGDAVALLKALIVSGEKFDIVLLDPPAFIKRRKDIKPGQKGYQRLNELALRLVAKDGLLVSSSCSLHCTREMLTEVIQHGSINSQRSVQIISQGHQALDHPVHPAIPETNYLKTCFCHVV